MARGAQFLSLVTRLRDETGRSSETAIGVDDLDSLKTILNRWYEMLWYSYDWPHLKITFPREALSAGENMYDLPTDLDLERIEQVVLWYNDIATPIERGISLEDYNLWNPELNERSDPVLKWDIRQVGNNLQVEVWPLPGVTQYLQFIGFRKFARLVNDADICYLDDQLVLMFAAAQILKRQENADADNMLSAANKHFNTLRKRGKAGETCYQLGLGYEANKPLPRAVIRIGS